MTDETQEVKLTYKQRAFIDEYLRDFNLTQAAIRAGYSEKTAYSIGSRLLKNVEIFGEVERRLEERRATANESLDLLTQHQRGDIGDFLDVSGMGFALDLQKAKAEGKTRLIKKLKQKTTIFSGKSEEDDREVHELEIELYDAQAAADKLLKVFGKYIDKTRAEDWRTDLIDMVKRGELSPEILLEKLDQATANEIILAAGVKL